MAHFVGLDVSVKEFNISSRSPENRFYTVWTHRGHCASFRQTDAASVIIDRDTEEADGAVVTSPVDLQENRKQLAAWFEGAESFL